MKERDDLDIKSTQSKEEIEAFPEMYIGKIIDKNGEEIPITEEMVQKACDDLLEAIN